MTTATLPSQPMASTQIGTQIALQLPAEPSEADLQFAQQLGVKYAVLWTDGAHAGYEYYASRRELFERAGLTIYGFGNWDVHNQDAIVLNLPGRDEKIEQYKQHLRALGKAGIPYTTYAHMANGIWSTAPQTTRGGAPARAFDLAQAESGHWFGRRYFMPLSHGRAYSEDEIWENFAYFIHEVTPVAEEAGVKIGIHPDDPPGVDLAGVPRCIFGNFAGYKRALEIADSPNVGVCFCVGCWLEGGELMGNGVLESIRFFAEQGKLFKVHFRNVDAPLPHFVETFVDDGYYDMYKVMRELVAAGFNGVTIADHIPLMAGDPRVGTAYTVAYMKALLRRAHDEAGA
ncbi:MAG TPA: mannonate dehydratase [Kouleothrix sp.]|uniref:mannonate dehydratase n=1 Tax=Kouleothrix sp. TaxID=2779161 RepID=UPI002C5E3619|nr:mannonate dehydratase [Kouleothrix sp.]HRC77258.1 mannonate dehydratase [Kouleothrix sp.]